MTQHTMNSDSVLILRQGHEPFWLVTNSDQEVLLFNDELFEQLEGIFFERRPVFVHCQDVRGVNDMEMGPRMTRFFELLYNTSYSGIESEVHQ